MRQCEQVRNIFCHRVSYKYSRKIFHVNRTDTQNWTGERCTKVKVEKQKRRKYIKKKKIKRRRRQKTAKINDWKIGRTDAILCVLFFMCRVCSFVNGEKEIVSKWKTSRKKMILFLENAKNCQKIEILNLRLRSILNVPWKLCRVHFVSSVSVWRIFFFRVLFISLLGPHYFFFLRSLFHFLHSFAGFNLTLGRNDSKVCETDCVFRGWMKWKRLQFCGEWPIK